MSSRLPDMSKAATTERLRHASAISDLKPERRLEGKLDMSSAGVTARLKEAAALLDLCRDLARAGDQARQSIDADD
jgi:hypothetical protein